MAKQTINIGTVANDRSGDPLRTAFTKVNENFTELYNRGSSSFSGSYNDLTNKPNIPDDIADLADSTSLLADIGDVVFIENAISAQDGVDLLIHTHDNDDKERVSVNLIPNTGALIATALSDMQDQPFLSNQWASAQWVTISELGYLVVTNSPAIINFINSARFNYATGISFRINGGDPIVLGNYTINGNNITFNTLQRVPVESPVVVNEINFDMYFSSNIAIDYDQGEIRLNAVELDINISTTENIGISSKIVDITGDGTFGIKNKSASDSIDVVTNSDASAETWSFGADGKLNLPTGGALEPVGMGWTGLTNGDSGTPLSIVNKTTNVTYSGQVISDITLTNNADTQGRISLNTRDLVAEEAYEWVFASDGSIIFPDNTIQTTAWGGGVDLENLVPSYDAVYDLGSPTNAWNNLYVKSGIISTIDISKDSSILFVANSSGDGFGYSTIELRPDSSTTQDQYIIIDPTFPNHIHMRAGGTQDNSQTDLFIGGESSHFRVLAGSNPNTQIAANNFVWEFRSDGTLYFPDGGNIRVGQVPGTSKGAVGDKVGTLAFNSSYIYYCTADYTTGTPDIWKRVAWSMDTW